jgi:hypothetical protein
MRGSFKIYQNSLKNGAKEFIKHFLIKAFLRTFLVRHVKKEGERAHIQDEIIKGHGHTTVFIPSPIYFTSLSIYLVLYSRRFFENNFKLSYKN